MQYTSVNYYDGAHRAGMVTKKLRFRTYRHFIFKNKTALLLSTDSLYVALEVIKAMGTDADYSILSKEQ